MSQSTLLGKGFKKNKWFPKQGNDSEQEYRALQQEEGEETDVSNQAVDFDTVDWRYDLLKERARKARLRSIKQKGRWWEVVGAKLDGGTAWLIVTLIGITTGITAAFIDIGVDWFSDIRTGHCSGGKFWLSKQVCCRNNRADEFSTGCAHWLPWSESTDIQYLMYVVFSVVFAGFSCFLVRVFAPFAAGSGIPEVKTILGGFVIRRFLGFWTLVIKTFGLILSVGSGLNLGKEGPLVHVAACWGNLFCRWFPKYGLNEGKKREMLSAAAAAGVSTAFGAPIGGVLFSLEEVSYYFPHKTMWRSFFAAVVAAVTLKLLDPFGTGHLILFQVNFHNGWHWFELPFFIGLGVIGGLIGAVFIHANAAWCSFRMRTRLGQFPVVDVFLVATATAVLNYLNPFTRINSSELIELLFQECDPNSSSSLCSDDALGTVIGLLLLAALAKLILTIWTFGLRVPAGLFVPSLAVGACIGRCVGMGMDYLQKMYPDDPYFAECVNTSNCITPGIYSLIGAASVLGGVTRMTISLVVIMLELTEGLEYVSPIMLAVTFSKWVGDAFGAEGIYDVHISLKRYPYLDNKELDVAVQAYEQTAADLMTDKRMHVLSATGNTLQSLTNELHVPYKGLPVVNSFQDMNVVGYIRVQELKHALKMAAMAGKPKTTHVNLLPPDNEDSLRVLAVGGSSNHNGKVELEDATGFVELDGSEDIDCHRLLDRQPILVDPTTPVERIYDIFGKLGLRYVLVSKVGRLRGIISKKDVLRWVARFSKHKKSSYHSDIGNIFFLFTQLPSLWGGDGIDSDDEEEKKD